MKKFLISFISLISVSLVASASTCDKSAIPKHLSKLDDKQRESILANAGWVRLEISSDEAVNYYEFNNRMPSWCNMVSQCWEIYKDSKGHILQLYRPDGVESAQLICKKKKIRINVQ